MYGCFLQSKRSHVPWVKKQIINLTVYCIITRMKSLTFMFALSYAKFYTVCPCFLGLMVTENLLSALLHRKILKNNQIKLAKMQIY